MRSTTLAPASARNTIVDLLVVGSGTGMAAALTARGLGLEALIVAMLASDDGAFITGTEIRVDGGTHQ